MHNPGFRVDDAGEIYLRFQCRHTLERCEITPTEETAFNLFQALSRFYEPSVDCMRAALLRHGLVITPDAPRGMPPFPGTSKGFSVRREKDGAWQLGLPDDTGFRMIYQPTNLQQLLDLGLNAADIKKITTGRSYSFSVVGVLSENGRVIGI